MRYVCAVFFAAGLAALEAAGQSVAVRQDGGGDYASIQAALDDPARPGNEIVVYPGRYEENVRIDEAVTLRSYEGPYFTLIDGHLRAGSQDAVAIAAGTAPVRVTGFTVARGRHGIAVGTSAHAILTNCVLFQNDLNGIYSTWAEDTPATGVEVYNNVFLDNGQDGMHIDAWRQFFDRDTQCYPVWVHNNVFADNGRYGIYLTEPSELEYVIDRASLVRIAHNDYHLNAAAAYGPRIGPGLEVLPGAGELFEDPLFVGQSGGAGPDAMLQSGSPCVDAGIEGPLYLDADGSRNDLGAFGGPYAASFYASVTDGPIVRSVTVSPGVVNQGETIVIEAIGAVR